MSFKLQRKKLLHVYKNICLLRRVLQNVCTTQVFKHFLSPISLSFLVSTCMSVHDNEAAFIGLWSCCDLINISSLSLWKLNREFPFKNISYLALEPLR